ncbi:MAG TPA: hypothetical protein VJ842_18750 [Pyrinomonadaceae bacterium]|nr:hypothetical protein [Pyrinomonadaceae bacterium]
MKQQNTENLHAATWTKTSGVRGHLAHALFCMVAALFIVASAASSARAQEDEVFANMSVEKTGPFEAVAGQTISYTITLTNFGTTDATNVVLTDNVPANTTPVSFTQDSGTPEYSLATTNNGFTYTASAGMVPAGSTATFFLTLAINSNTPNGATVTNTATVTSDSDADESNNSSSVNTVISTMADLGATKSGPTTANAGDTITYTISIFNNGVSDAQNATLTDQAPPGTTPVSFMQLSGPAFNINFNGVDTYTAQAASFAAGATAVFEMVVSVNRNVLNGTIITNGATATSSTPDPDTSNNTMTVDTTLTNTMHVVISEFRFRGAGGVSDEFIEIYNDSNSPLTVQSTDEPVSNAVVSGGWAIVAADGMVRCTIPNGTVIPARGHYLCVNSAGYSLNGYPAGTATNSIGNATYTTDIPDDSGVGLFSSQSCFCGATLLDSVGFSSVTDPLYREGTGLGLPVNVNAQFSFVRRLESGVPQDTNSNTADFVLVATDPLFVGNGAQLGGPGPENTFSPTQRNATIKASLIAPQQPTAAFPNRARTGTPVPNGAFGTLSIRRRFTNATGQTLTRLRFRAVNMTTLGTPVSISPQADMRLITSGDFGITVDSNSFTVRGTILEQPPAQPLGGGLNSTVTVTLPGGGLAPGASIELQFLLGVQQEGNFRFLINTEGLTNPPTLTDSATRKNSTRGK